MSLLTDNLLQSLNTLLRSGNAIPATDLRAFEAQVIAAIAILEARARGNTIHYTPGVPPDSLGLEGDLGVNQATGDFYQYTGGTFVFLFNGLGKTGTFAPVTANQYGTHPAFATQRELDSYLLQHLGTGTVTTPAVPTITGFTPTSGGVGVVLTLAGTNFGASAGTSGMVKFNGLLAYPTAWSNTSITVPVPTGATTGALIVITAAGTATSSTSFTVSGASTAVKAWRYKKLGQSNSVGSGPINPSTDPNSVAYDPADTLTGGVLSAVTPAITVAYSWVHIWNNTAQAWQPYNPLTNAQGFTGAEVNGTTTYVPGVCSYLGLAYWWEHNRAGEYLLLEKAGAVGQAISYFQKAGSSGAYAAVANKTWIPASAALPAYATSLNVTETHVLGYEWTQGETEDNIPNYAANLTTLMGDLVADGYWPRTTEDVLVISPSVNEQAAASSAGMRDLQVQKNSFISGRARTVTYSPERVSLLKDEIHWDILTEFRLGSEDLPEALGIKTVSDKFFFKGFAGTAGNSTTLWKDESSARNNLYAKGTALPILANDTTLNLKAYAVQAAGHSKMEPRTFGGFHAVSGFAKTLILVLQQPVVTAAPLYLFENGSYAASPSYSLGPIAARGSYIGTAQDTSKLTILVFELAADGSGTFNNGILSVYNGGTLKGSGPVDLARIDGFIGSKFSLFSTVSALNNQYDSVPSTFLAAFIAYPGVSASRRNALLTEIAAKIPIGSAYNAATPAPVGPTVTAAEPAGIVSTLNFAPVHGGIYLNAAGNWYRPSGAIITDSLATGLATSYLAANTSGRVLFRYKDASAYNGAVGLHTALNRVGISTMAFGLYVNTSGTLAAISNGVALAQTYPATIGRYYAITRIGNTGAVRVEESADATTWTTLFTYAATTAAALYVPMHLATAGALLESPQAQSLSTLNVAAPGGNFVTTRQSNDPGTGGFALVPATLLAPTAAATYWFYWKPDTLTTPSGFSQYQLPLAIGASGGADETFSLTVDAAASPATINARVRSAGGAFTFTDNLTLPTVGAGYLIALRLDATGIQLNVNGTATAIKPTGYAPAASSAGLSLGAGVDTAKENIPQLPASGSYACLGIANRLFTDAEITQLVNAAGQVSSISGTTSFFPLTGLLTSSTTVADVIDNTKAVALYSGAV